MNDPIQDAYAALRTAGPLSGGLDCGKLCGARCCTGTQEDGMELFHGEEKLFAHDPAFEIRTDGTRSILVCRGKCERRFRPLSCRMFPLFPVPHTEDGRVRMRVCYDLRGYAVCPLLRAHFTPDPRFVRAVRMAGYYLIRDPENERLLRQTGALFEELVSFTQFLSDTKED